MKNFNRRLLKKTQRRGAQFSLFVFVARVLQRFEQFERVERLELVPYSDAIERNDKLCENSGTFKTVEKGHHIHDRINDLIPKSVSFILQSGTT